jgi:hypothetical protein
MWRSPARYLKSVHVWRARRSTFGELVMMDSSPYRRLEERGPRYSKQQRRCECRRRRGLQHCRLTRAFVCSQAVCSEFTSLRGTELRRGTSVSPEVDSASIEQQVEAIRTALGRIRTIKIKVTELGGCAEVITEQVSQLREDFKEALLCIEESMWSAQTKKPAPGSVVLMDKTAAAH